ncbi:MAG: hypothetical protein FWD65_01470 [Coriobacteriia bacterium]|nr:hypothetical protein [Coriobacteriia bacterium]
MMLISPSLFIVASYTDMGGDSCNNKMKSTHNCRQTIQFLIQENADALQHAFLNERFQTEKSELFGKIILAEY